MSTDQCAHVDKVCNLVDRFQQWRGYECPYCEIARLQALGDELAGLLEEARNERDQYKQQRADWKAAYEGLLERSASTRG